jgi:hypothetical protein
MSLLVALGPFMGLLRTGCGPRLLSGMASVTYAGTSYEISNLEAGADKNVIRSVVTQSRTEWIPHIWKIEGGKRIASYLLVTAAVPVVTDMNDEDDAAAQLGSLMRTYAPPLPLVG